MSTFSPSREAVRQYLIRALTGDAERLRPPVTLAGPQTNGSTPPPTPLPPTPSPPPPVRTQGPHVRRQHTHAYRAEFQPGDEQGAYSREQLVQMDDRFRTRLLQAFESGKESWWSAANQVATPRRAPPSKR
jgi:hypothetical protein